MDPIGQRVADWLNALPGHERHAEPVRVRLGRTYYDGARFTDEHGRKVFYLVGERPAAHRRSKRVVWKMPGEPYEYYVGGYIGAKSASGPQYSRFHPFGATFNLFPWSVPSGEAIDQYEPAGRKYRRLYAGLYPAEA